MITSSWFTMTAELEPTFIVPVPMALYTPGTICVNLYAAAGAGVCAWKISEPRAMPANASASRMRIMNVNYALVQMAGR